MSASARGGGWYNTPPWFPDPVVEGVLGVSPLNEGFTIRDLFNGRDHFATNNGGRVTITAPSGERISLVSNAHTLDVQNSALVQSAHDGNLGGGGNYGPLYWDGQTNKRTGIGVWSTSFIYKKLHVNGGTNSTGGWTIMSQWENDTAGSWTGLLLNVHSGNQGKGGLAMERKTTNGRGHVWLVNDGVDDSGECNLGDKVAGWLYSGYYLHKAPDAAPTDSDIPTSFVAAYLDEAGNALKFRVRYADGTTLKTGSIALT